MALIATADGVGWLLSSPALGKFRPTMPAGSRLHPDGVLGILEVLGTAYELVVPPGASGCVSGESLAPRVVDYLDPLARLVPGGLEPSQDDMPPSAITPQASGLVFRAPTSGRFYGRAAPDKPAFVSAGDELAAGATVCLLEVMKTFHRVHYGGDAVPERARVRDVLVKDGDDVNAGDPLLALEAI